MADTSQKFHREGSPRMVKNFPRETRFFALAFTKRRDIVHPNPHCHEPSRRTQHRSRPATPSLPEELDHILARGRIPRDHPHLSHPGDFPSAAALQGDSGDRGLREQRERGGPGGAGEGAAQRGPQAVVAFLKHDQGDGGQHRVPHHNSRARGGCGDAIAGFRRRRADSATSRPR